MKKALVVVSFGSTHSSAIEELTGAEQYIGKSYPDRDLFCSYSSGFVRSKLKESGKNILSLEEILDILIKENYQDVLVQPTHIIPGHEYDKIKAITDIWKGRFEKLTMGLPLISNADDVVKISKELMDIYKLRENEALLLFGHGTDHKSNFIYPALQTAFRTIGGNHVYIATVEGWPTLEDAIVQMKNDNMQDVFIAPFLLCGGEHVKNDMLGESEESWLNRLLNQGFHVRYSNQGLSAYEQIMRYYITTAD